MRNLIRYQGLGGGFHQTDLIGFLIKLGSPAQIWERRGGGQGELKGVGLEFITGCQ